MKKYKTAIVGLGRSAWQFHLPELLKYPELNLCAWVEPLPERLKDSSDKFGKHTSYTSLTEMLVKEKPDLTVLASPTIFHLEQIIEIFQHGSDIFCEKPFTISYYEALQAYKAMKKYNRKMMVFQRHRNLPVVNSLQSILESGKLGNIFQVRRGIFDFKKRSDWQAMKQNGGGMLLNYGAHFIDQFMYLFKDRITDVHCSLKKILSCGNAEDVVKAVFQTQSGIMFDLDINTAAAIPGLAWAVYGSRGAAIYDQMNTEWKLCYLKADNLDSITAQNSLAAECRSYNFGEQLVWEKSVQHDEDYKVNDYYEKVIDYFMLDKAPFVPIEESMEVMRVISQAEEDASKETGKISAPVLDTEKY